MRRTRLLPFHFTPASWGLKDQAYDEAEICYYYEGEEMETRLAKLRQSDGTDLAKALLAIELKYEHITKYDADRRMLEIEGRHGDRRALLDIEFSHGKIDEYTYGRSIIELENEGIARDVALLNHDLAHERIEPRAHAKAVATAQGIPWVGVVNDEFNPNLGIEGFAIELDWNKEWIEYLKLHGYVGRSESEIVDAWFVDVNREQAEVSVELGTDEIWPPVMPRAQRPRGPMPRLRQ